MIRSAHIDTFARDHLPPAEQQPDFLLDSPDVCYPERINCIAAFVDDWVAKGHGEHDCLISPTERLTYAGLAERVNRIANVLTRDLGLVPGNRVLLRGPNSPMMVAAYFAVIKAGGVVVATMPLLRAKEIAFPLDEGRDQARAVRRARSPTRWKRRSRSRRRSSASSIGAPATPTVARSADGAARLREFRRLRHRRRRCLPDRLHLRHHRRAARAPCISTATCWRSATASPATCCARRPRRPLHRLAAARLHLRARRPRAVPAAGRRRRPCCWKRPARTSLAAAIERFGATVCFTAPTAYRAMLGKLADARPLLAAQMRLRRRDAAEGDLRRPGSSGDRHQASSTASARPRCCTSSSARAEDDIRPGAHRQAGAGLRGDASSTTSRPRGAARHASAGSRCAARPAAAISPTSARRKYVQRRLERHRRHLSDGTTTAISGTRRAPTT